MSENEKYISRTDEMGSINISQDVLAVIAAAAALEVEGVGSMSAGASNDVAELTNRKVLSKGVRLAMEEEQIAIDLALTIKFGYAVPEVAQAVQDAVQSAVESTSGLSVKCVNVTITGVLFQNSKA